MVSLLGPDRFQSLLRSDAVSAKPAATAVPSQSLGLSTIGQRLGESLALRGREREREPTSAVSRSKPYACTPPPIRASTDGLTHNSEAAGALTGPRPSPPASSRTSEKEDIFYAPVGKFEALSLRLRGAHLRQSWDSASTASRNAPPLAGSASGAVASVPPDVSEQSLGFLERGRAFGEAFEKKAKLSAAPPVPSAVVASSCEAKGVLQRGRLTEWMELAARHAPPQTRNARAVAGGLQDAYLRAVRGHLTSASLRSAGSAEAHGSRGTGELFVVVDQSDLGPEGLLISGFVSEAVEDGDEGGNASLRSLTGGPGGPVRLLLHRGHPAMSSKTSLQQESDQALRHQMHGREQEHAWIPVRGTVLDVRGVRVIAQGTRAGPLLLPLEVLEVG
eukprot:TRINITY_DN1850_c0_g3_i1.p1 TRINITY_DN1850_c0_g3~~TRINITY_DN1850_c0_g3_i1.p1  ORF type:complete len:391 (-),score=50.15 TRINITY_DN1850_c0_g3_i1:323-1495(-)